MSDSASGSRTELYGKLAFGAIVLVTFADMLRVRRATGEPWQLVVVFALGAFYVALGILGMKDRAAAGSWKTPLYFVVQCTLFTAMVFLNPLQGFFGLAAMPLASMAVLDLPRRWAAVVVLELWAASAGAIGITFGFEHGLWAILSYATAFVFTVLFSELTRRAIHARHHAEQLSTELATANEQLRRHATQADELATARERNRIAREIHDGVGHYLTTINVQIEAARAVLSSHPQQAADSLAKAARLSREALDDIRRSVGALVVDAPPIPLSVTLQSFAQNLGLAATVRVRGIPRPLPSAIEHALSRAGQEALTNVFKHAAATSVDVTLDYTTPSKVTLAVADDGRGCPPAPLPGGHGLQGMRERIAVLGGQLVAANRPEGGFLVRIELPA